MKILHCILEMKGCAENLTESVENIQNLGLYVSNDKVEFPIPIFGITQNVRKLWLGIDSLSPLYSQPNIVDLRYFQLWVL